MASSSEGHSDQLPRLLSVRDTAEVLRCGKTSIYKLLADQALRSVTIGRRRLIFASSVNDLIAGSVAHIEEQQRLR